MAVKAITPVARSKASLQAKKIARLIQGRRLLRASPITAKTGEKPFAMAVEQKKSALIAISDGIIVGFLGFAF